jgi:2'-5' RNA ligase
MLPPPDPDWAALQEGASLLGPMPDIRAEWLAGRADYCVWALHIDDPAVRTRMAAVAAALGPLITPCPVADAHITLFVAGFPNPEPTREDDVLPAVLNAQEAALSALSAPAFTLQIGAARSFRSAPYLQVVDPDGALDRLRAALGPFREQRFGPFTPHLTVGHIAADGPAAPLLAALAPFVDLPALPVHVRAVHRMVFDGRRAHSPLRLAATVRLHPG